MVGLGRVELPTRGLGNRCSIRLSYRPGERTRLILSLFLTLSRKFRCESEGYLQRLRLSKLLTRSSGQISSGTQNRSCVLSAGLIRIRIVVSDQEKNHV